MGQWRSENVRPRDKSYSGPTGTRCAEPAQAASTDDGPEPQLGGQRRIQRL